MKATLQFPVESLAGAATPGSGLVFTKWRGIFVARKYVTPNNPQSVNQVSIRSILTQCAQGFKQLSATQKEQWSSAATKFPIYVNGKTVTLPAGNFYMRINSFRLIDGQTLSAVAPSATPDFAASAIGTPTYNSGTGALAFTITHNNSSISSDSWVVKITGNIDSDVKSLTDNDFRYAAGVNTASIVVCSASVQSVSISAPVFTNYVNAKWIGIEVVPLNSGYVPGTPYRVKKQITVS